MVSATIPPSARPPSAHEADAAHPAGLWWVLALRGCAAIALGLFALLWPVMTVLTLTLLFAAYNLVEGVFSIVLAVRGARHGKRWGLAALHGVVALVAAAVVILFPTITLMIFVALLIAWALVNGLLAVIAAFGVGRTRGRWWLLATGAASLLLAALLMALPPVGLFTLAWMFAFYALVAGISMLGLAFRLRATPSPAPANGAPVDVGGG